jgi:hypothetical protein
MSRVFPGDRAAVRRATVVRALEMIAEATGGAILPTPG